MRETNDAGLSLTKESEGLRLRRYLDVAGNPSIGYGHLCSADDGLEEITPEFAEQLLRNDLQNAQNGVDALVSVPLSDNQFAALVDFTFNLGRQALRGSSLLRFLNAGEYDRVPAELMKWVHAGGEVQPGLVIRRQREADLWNTP